MATNKDLTIRRVIIDEKRKWIIGHIPPNIKVLGVYQENHKDYQQALKNFKKQMKRND